MRAATHIMRSTRRIPLHSLLDSLEQTVCHLAPVSSPIKQAKVAARAQSARDSAKRALHMKAGTLTPRSARGSSGGGCLKAQAHTQKAVIELYEAYVVRQEVDEARRRDAEKREGVAGALSARLPDAGTFMDVLRLYYPTFTTSTLEMMTKDAKAGIDAIDRRAFISSAKGSYADRMRLAFSKSDKDGSGGLSVDEFVTAIQRCGAQPPGFSRDRPATRDDLAAMFKDADEDGNGLLDFDEFLELCARQTWLVSAFERIVDAGVRHKLRSEEARLSAIFRHPVSPRSRLVLSPTSGRRRRPSMFNLRTTDEVADTLARAERAETAAG
jgi:Ca2+-binding EF-hand superfamily protein